MTARADASRTPERPGNDTAVTGTLYLSDLPVVDRVVSQAKDAITMITASSKSTFRTGFPGKLRGGSLYPPQMPLRTG